MTTHDRDKVIAAAKEAGFAGWGRLPFWIERLYAIAHEAGRVDEREECNQDAERHRWLCEQNEKGNGYFHIGIGARGLSGWRNKHELDDLIDSARSTK